MVLGYSTNAFVRFSLAEALAKIAALGFGGIEIMAERPHLRPGDYGEVELARLKGLLRDSGLVLTNINSFRLLAGGGGHSPSWIEAEPERRRLRIQHTLDCLRVARQLGCKSICVPPGGHLGSMSCSEALRLFYRGLEQVIPLAEELGVKILIEPEPEGLLRDGSQFRGFVAEVRSRAVGLNFDIGHSFCAGEDPAVSFAELFQWIGHVHLEDIAADRVHQHLIPGEGAINFLEIFKTMARLGYRGHLSLELYPYAEAPEPAGLQSLNFLRPLFQEAGLQIAA